MSKTVFLDTGVLGYLTHPKGSETATRCIKWLLAMLEAGATVCLPEICDYELRRDYLRRNASKALGRLDALKDTIDYVPIESAAMLKASEFWAEARAKGRPTADDKALDGDVILAGQAAVFDPGSEIATTNVGHLALFLPASSWEDVKP